MKIAAIYQTPAFTSRSTTQAVRLFFLLVFYCFVFNNTCLSQSLADSSKINSLLSGKGIRFIENRGQVADMEGNLRPDILFTSASKAVQLFLHATGIDYQFTRTFKRAEKNRSADPVHKSFDQFEKLDSIQTYRVELRLAGANPHTQIIRDGVGKDVENYYLAYCPQGILAVKNYQKLIYRNVYPNIDWIVYSRDGVLKYDFVLHPGSNINDIRLEYKGCSSLNINDNGELEINTPFGNLIENAPYTYQDAGKEIKSRFKLHNKIISFDIENYDHGHDLVIDPSITWSTYYGGQKDDVGMACTVDRNDDIYVTGYSQSNNGISSGGFQNTYTGGASDAFMVKFSPDGSRQWATYYGGNGLEAAADCVTDAVGNVYMCGGTTSASGIASAGFQNTYGGGFSQGDGYLVKFAPTGTRIWATYYGGANDDEAISCAVDNFDNVYICGRSSSDGLASGGFQNIKASYTDAIMIKFSSAGSRIWATYYGGESEDYGFSCCIDQAGNIYMSGQTNSATGIASGGFQSTPNSTVDAFLVKFSPACNRIWATYYGGEGFDLYTTCRADINNNVYLYGLTTSASGIAYCGFQNAHGGGNTDPYLVKFNESGSRVWGTYFGGPGDEDYNFNRFVIDQQSNIYLPGATYSTSGIAFGGFQNTVNAIKDAYLVKFTTSCTRVWATYFGGNNFDIGLACALDQSANIYMTGATKSNAGIATAGAFQTVPGSAPNTSSDAFFVKINNPVVAAPGITGFTSAPSCIAITGTVITITGTNFTGATNVSFGGTPAASFTVVNATTIQAVVGAGASGVIAVTTANGTAVFCGFVFCNSSPVSVSISASPGNNVCAGADIDFSALPVNGGTAPVYQWQVNGINVGTNSNTYSTNTLSNGDVVSCIMLSNASCVQCVPVASNYITMNISAGGPPSITIAASATNICQANAVIFTATPVNGGTSPGFQWQVNGINVGSNSNIYNSNTLNNADIVTCILTSNSSCANPVTATSNAMVITVNNQVVPSISIAASTTTICQGSSINFVASPLNGGTTAAYQWQVNGINVGTNSNSYNSSSLNNADVVTCILTSDASCANPITATSNSISITVNNLVVPLISITASSTTICSGATVNFTATPVNGGSSPNYQWRVNGINVGSNINTYTSSTLNNADLITCILTSNASCANPATATSNSISMTVNNLVVPSISITSSSATICSGATVNFTATPANGGSSPNYQWQVNGINVGTNINTYTSSTLNNTDLVTCILTSNASCANPATATSNSISITVNNLVVPLISITASSTAICSGATVNFTATPVNGGSSPTYQWQVNGINVGTNTNTYSSSTLNNADLVNCILTSNASCVNPVTANSNFINITVTSQVAASIIITASSTSICEGTTVNFTATPGNGGTSPNYQWQVNGISVGSNSNTYNNNTLNNTDIVTCILTSNSSCATPATVTSNTIIITVNNQVIPSISIAASSITICPGTMVNFTATPVNGGSIPSYQWQVNGINVGSNSNTYNSNTLNNADIITCILTSNVLCASAAAATSNTIAITVNNPIVPSISIAASSNTICTGTTVNFTATAVNGGTLPNYQWQVNGINVGTNSNIYNSSTLNNGDVVSCILTSSANCVNPATALSNNISITVNNLGVPSISITASSTIICPGTTVNFAATPVNGGTTASYQWQVNGVNVGTNSAVYSSNTLNNADVVNCILTSNASCVNPATATSNNISIIVNNIVAPSISITASSTIICPGTIVNFAATLMNAGTLPTYQWQVNGANVGVNTNTYSSSTLNNADVISCILTSNAPCVNPATTTSNVISITVNSLVVPSINITASSTAICQGTVVSFTATAVNGGTAPIYQWQLNGINVGTNSNTYSNGTLNNADIITCLLTSNASCANPVAVASNNISINVNSLVVPSISITASSTITCSGTAVNFTAMPVNGGTTPTYQWQVNGVNVGTNNNTYSSNTLNNADMVSCILTSSVSCANPVTATSNNISITVNSLVVPSITITASSTTICPGTAVIFTAIPVNGGTTPNYQWQVNGINVGSNSNTYNSNTLNNADIITCILTSNVLCASAAAATSNTIAITVNNPIVPSISIAASSNTICAGTTVNFTATAVNGGTLPNYQWQVNGINAGSNTNTYSSSTLNNADIVGCMLTSNASCVNPATVTSNLINIAVNNVVVPSISITASSTITCAGTNINFTATPVNGGTSPNYQWQVNGVNVGTNSNIYSSTTLNNADVVSCILTSNASCANPAMVTSNLITMAVNSSVVPSIAIASSTTSVCTGTLVSFTATAINGGTAPNYQWQVNGTNVGTSSGSYSSSTLNNADIITCILTSNASCANLVTVTSNSIGITVSSPVVPSMSITASSTYVCTGSSVSFTATAVNGGTAPGYQWQINGINVGINAAVYSSNTLNNADIITCILTSNAACIVSQTALSNPLLIQVIPLPAIVISSSAAGVCPGEKLTFTAASSNAGTLPAYEWQVNGFHAGNGPTFSSSNLHNNDIVSCLLTPGNGSCTSAIISANNIYVHVYTPPVISVQPVNTSVMPGAQVHFTTNISANTSSFTWGHAASLINPTSLNPLTVPLDSTTHFLFQAQSTEGCISEQKITVIVLGPFQMPTAFTPNHDWLNDLFRIPVNTDFLLKEFSVFDRWGNRVFFTSDRQIGWDGNFKGMPCATGSYVYNITGSDRRGAVNIKGMVTLIR